MATIHHLSPAHEALRRAAARVIREYRSQHEITADSSPEGMLLRLRHELALALDELETALGEQNSGDEPAETNERPEITVLVGDHCDAIFGLYGIAQAICKLDEPESIDLAIAARALASRLYGGLGSLLSETEQKIEAATGMKVRT